MDYVASPRVSLTTNWTRSVFEEVVRRRDELRAQLLAALDALVAARNDLRRGPPSHAHAPPRAISHHRALSRHRACPLAPRPGSPSRHAPALGRRGACARGVSGAGRQPRAGAGP